MLTETGFRQQQQWWIPSASNIDWFCSCQFNIQATEIISWSNGSGIIQLFHSSIFLPASQVNVTIDSKHPEVRYSLTVVQEVWVCHFVAAMLREAHQAPITILISYDEMLGQQYVVPTSVLEQRQLWNTHCFLSSSSRITGLTSASRTVSTISWWKTSQKLKYDAQKTRTNRVVKLTW